MARRFPRPFHTVQIDLQGPFVPEGTDCVKYIRTVICAKIRYPCLRGLVDKRRETVLEGFSAAKMAKFSVDGLKAYQRWQANFQNWQIRIGQVSHLLQDNLRFLTNVLDWATAHEALVDIRSKGDTRRPMQEVKSEEARMMRITAIVGAPLLLLLLGLARLQLRRRRSSQLQDVS